MKRRTVVSLSVLATLCILAAFAVYAVGMRKPNKSTAFTLRGKAIYFNSDGTRTVSDYVHYESASGSWRKVETRPDGYVWEQLFVQGRGYFRADHIKRRLLTRSGDARLAKIRDNVVRSVADEILASPQFTRTEILLGYTAYVSQVRDGDILMGEVYVVPELGRSGVKHVSYDAEGKVILVLEPESITLGEPDAADLKWPAYPEVVTK